MMSMMVQTGSPSAIDRHRTGYGLSVAYMTSDILRGYGPLDVAVDACLQAWHQAIAPAMDGLSRAVERQVVPPVDSQEVFVAACSECQNRLTNYQRAAFGSFLHVFVRSLLALKALALCGVPPICPAFASPYSMGSITQLMSMIQEVSRDVQALEAALGLPAPWSTAWIDTVVYYTNQAQEASQQIFKATHRLERGQRQRVFDLYQATHRLYRRSLDLQGNH